MTLVLAASCLISFFSCSNNIPGKSGIVSVARMPRMDPDYTSLVIPQNIAPLNFTIKEPGIAFFVDLHGGPGPHVQVKSAKPEIRIPAHKWKKLLSSCAGKPLYIDVHVLDIAKSWQRFATITNTVACEKIDDYLLYRLIPPLYTRYGKMGVYQRTLSHFTQKPVWLNRMSHNNCMNCHTFKGNDPDYMAVHMRGGKGNGTLIKRGRDVFKVQTETAFNTPAGNPAWHPSGDFIAFSVNKVRQFFHETGSTREGIDMASDIILYTIASNTISSPPSLSDPRFMETMPEWSPDGKYLYYCRAPQFPQDSFIEYHAKIYYDLMRLPFDANTLSWGTPEPLLTHTTTGKSFSLPKVSPDGKFLLCSMADYGNFTTFRPGGDIVLYETATGNHRVLDVNTGAPESFPIWSSNSRWMLFSSKRKNGICSYLYISHIDSAGFASKPFILPQRDPHVYESLCMTYNFPCFLIKPFAMTPTRLVETFEDNARIRKAALDEHLKQLVEAGKKDLPAGASASGWSQNPGQSSNH